MATPLNFRLETKRLTDYLSLFPFVTFEGEDFARPCRLVEYDVVIPAPVAGQWSYTIAVDGLLETDIIISFELTTDTKAARESFNKLSVVGASANNQLKLMYLFLEPTVGYNAHMIILRRDG